MVILHRTARILLIVCVTLISVAAFGQGTIYVSNVSGSEYRAPVFGQELEDPMMSIHGNSSAGIPAGTVVYTGSPLSGNGFSAELFGGPTDVFDGEALAPCTVGGSRAIFRFGTGAAAGFIANPYVVNVPGVQPGSTAHLQLRAWYNAGGAITSFSEATVRGASTIFTSSPLGGDQGSGSQPLLPPGLEGLTSFNLTGPALVPEPGSLALLAMGALFFTGKLCSKEKETTE